MNIISVKYVTHTDENGEHELSEREYNYFCSIPCEVGDEIEVPVRKSLTKAIVTEIEIPEERVAKILPFLKTIEPRVFVEPEDRDMGLEVFR